MLKRNFIQMLVYKILRLRTELRRKRKMDILLYGAGKIPMKCRNKTAIVVNIQRKMKIIVKLL